MEFYFLEMHLYNQTNSPILVYLHIVRIYALRFLHTYIQKQLIYIKEIYDMHDTNVLI